MTKSQEATLNQIRAGVAARGAAVQENISESDGAILIRFGDRWPTIRIGRRCGIDLLEIRTYHMPPLEAAIRGDILYEKQQARDRTKHAMKYGAGTPLVSNLPSVSESYKAKGTSLQAQSMTISSRLDVNPANGSDIARLLCYIEAHIDLGAALKGPPNYWTSLPLCVIDSVWSIQAKYLEQVCPLIHRFRRSVDPPWEGETCDKPTTDRRPTIEEFINVIEERLNNGQTYERLFVNRQRTSSRNGILKAEAVHLFANALMESGINNFSDLQDKQKIEAAWMRIKEIPGQGTGITFKYFLNQSGIDDYVKADTHIRKFVARAVGVHSIQAERAEGLVLEAAAQLAPAYPGLTAGSLDYAIWNFQKTTAAKRRRS